MIVPDQDSYVSIVLYDGDIYIDSTRADAVTMRYITKFEREDEWAFSAMVF